MPELQPAAASAAAANDAAGSSLTSSFKDMMKKEKKMSLSGDGSGGGDVKKVTVKIDGKKVKNTGCKSSNKKGIATSHLVRKVSIVHEVFGWTRFVSGPFARDCKMQR